MLAKQYVCHICNITIKKASKSGHLKTKTHLNNIKKKFNKIAFLPLDLQHTIMEYIPFSRYTSSFSIQLAHKSVRALLACGLLAGATCMSASGLCVSSSTSRLSKVTYTAYR